MASWTSSTESPPRSACWTRTIRPSVGRLEASRWSRRTSPAGTSPSQWKVLPDFSRLRSAFCRASVNERPMAIASPTDFIVVVRVSSAAGNFSKANRGALTTT